eukprot:300249_1
MTALDAEGTDTHSLTKSDLDQWLVKWNLTAFKEALQSHGISSPDDVKFIRTEKQFDELVASLDNINFIQKCKLRTAWESVVPNPTPHVAQIHFLGDEEKTILNVLNQRFTDLSKDIQYLKASLDAFNESIVSSTKQVNDSAEELISIINNRKRVLLGQIESLKTEKQKLFSDKLDALDRMNQVIKKNKSQFVTIGSNNNITSEERLKQLKKLLIVDGDRNDDEKQQEAHAQAIGNQCVVPDRLSFTFNKQSFESHLRTNLDVQCTDLTTKWNLKTEQNVTCGFVFDVCKATDFNISENGTVATAKPNGCTYSLISTTTALNHGIHKWKIKIVQEKHNPSVWNPSVGVVTDVAKAMQAGTGSTNGGFKCFRYAYLWDNEQYNKLCCFQNGTRQTPQGNSHKIVQGDVITMTLNCNKWTLEFLQNDQPVGTLQVQPNESYHPMIYSCGCVPQQYKLL